MSDIDTDGNLGASANSAMRKGMLTSIRQYMAACSNANEAPSWDSLNAFYAGQIEAYQELTAVNDLKPSGPADSLRPSESHILDTIKTELPEQFGIGAFGTETESDYNWGFRNGVNSTLFEVLAIINKHRSKT